MKTLNYIGMVAAAILLAGCDKDSTPTSSEGKIPTNFLGDATSNTNSAIDVSYLNQALSLYNTQEGHYPKTLDELKPNYVQMLPLLPPGMKLDYDVTNGTVKVVGQ